MENVEGQVQNPEGEVKEEKTEVQQLLERVKQLESSNQRLLDESKSYKEKYKTVAGQFEQLEETRLTKEKDYEGLLKMHKERALKVEADYRKLKEDTMRKSLQLELATHAKDAHDVMDVYNNLPENLVKFNEETLSFEGVEDAVKLLRDKKHYLFAQSVPKMVSSKPEAKPLPKEKTLMDAVKNDALGVLGELVQKGVI